MLSGEQLGGCAMRSRPIPEERGRGRECCAMRSRPTPESDRRLCSIFHGRGCALDIYYHRCALPFTNEAVLSSCLCWTRLSYSCPTVVLSSRTRLCSSYLPLSTSLIPPSLQLLSVCPTVCLLPASSLLGVNVHQCGCSCLEEASKAFTCDHLSSGYAVAPVLVCL